MQLSAVLETVSLVLVAVVAALNGGDNVDASALKTTADLVRNSNYNDAKVSRGNGFSLSFVARQGDSHPHKRVLQALQTSKTNPFRSDAVVGGGTTIGTTVFPNVETEFYAPITIGTPGQTFNMLFDTGSFDLWVISSKCSSSVCLTAKNSYKSTSSSTYSNPNQASYPDKYADGTVITGQLAIDTVSVAGFSTPNVQFTEATSYTAPQTQGANDSEGIVGLSLPVSSATVGHTVNNPLIQLMIDNKIISTPQFGYYVAPGENNGQITFGGYDNAYFADPNANISWFPVNPSTVVVGQWALPLGSLSVGTTSLSFTQSVVIMDTGTSLGYMPSSLLDAFGSQISNSRKFPLGGGVYTYEVPCTAKTSGPMFTLTTTSGGKLTLPAASSVIDLGGGQCVVGFLSDPTATTSQATILLGNTFLKQYYSIFDYGTKQIGFTLAKGRSGSGATAGGNGAAAGLKDPAGGVARVAAGVAVAAAVALLV